MSRFVINGPSWLEPSLAYGGPSYMRACHMHLRRLKRLQNAGARVITSTRGREHITPFLRKLHWLPVRQRVEIKLTVLKFNVLNGLVLVFDRRITYRQDTTRSVCRSNAVWLCRARRTARLDRLVSTRSTRVVSERDEQSGIWA